MEARGGCELKSESRSRGWRSRLLPPPSWSTAYGSPESVRCWADSLPRRIPQDSLFWQILRTHENSSFVLGEQPRERVLYDSLGFMLELERETPGTVFLCWGEAVGGPPRPTPGAWIMRGNYGVFPQASEHPVTAILEILILKGGRIPLREAIFFLWGCAPSVLALEDLPRRRCLGKQSGAWLRALTEAFIEAGLGGAPVPPLATALQILNGIGDRRPDSKLAAAAVGTGFSNPRVVAALARSSGSHREIYEEARLISELL